MARVFIGTALTCLILLRIVSSEQCYYPAGDVETAYKPCNSSLSSSGGSACCDASSGDLCTDTGLCIGHAGHWYRGGCTDSTFTPGPCASVCLTGMLQVTLMRSESQQTHDLELASTTTYSNLIYCGQSSDGADAYWCCSDDSEASFCCDEKKLQFVANDAWGTYWWHIGAVSSTLPKIITTTTTATATVGTGAGASAGNGQSAQHSHSSHHLETTLRAGLGVPLGLSLLAIGILAFLLWRERRRSNRSQQRSIPQEMGQNGPTAGYSPVVQRAAHVAPAPIPQELDNNSRRMSSTMHHSPTASG